jgi:hypothetical protein
LGFIPASAKWYLAEIVVQITVEDDPRNVLQTNTVLVRADSPEEGHAKAMELGRSAELSYENPNGKLVKFHFLGLHDLNVIHDELEHGAEIAYSETIGLDESAIEKWITPKESLGVFAPITPSTGPNYSSRDVMEKVHRMMAESEG